MNVAIYGAAGRRWAMTERKRDALHQEAAALKIGPSSLTWEDGALVIKFDEVSAPIPARVRGSIRLRPAALVQETFALDREARHVWRPIAPRADVEVTLDDPACTWRGKGYFDTNGGDQPLERGFRFWDWCRAQRPRDTLIFYDVERRAGDKASLALKIDAEGAVQIFDPPPAHTLGPTFWRMPRHARGETSDSPKVRETLEDTPFYTRTALDGRYGGEPAEIVHESLSLDRLRSPLVRAMLPFRMPRRFF